MSDTPAPLPPGIPPMSTDQARDIARGLTRIALLFAKVGMHREAERYERDGLWWAAHAITLANTKPEEG